jgi:hypothetical protein
LAEVENTAENLLTALAGINIEAGKTTEKISILVGQLKKASLSLVIARKKEAIITLRVRYTIYRLVTSRV